MEPTNYRVFLIRLTSVRLFADDQRAVDACIRTGDYYNAIHWLQKIIDWIEDMNNTCVLDNLKRLKVDLEIERANRNGTN